MRHGGRKEYDFIWAVLKTTKSPAEEGHAAYVVFCSPCTNADTALLSFAIGAAEDSVLMAETFERLLKQNDSNVDWLLAALSANPKSRRPMVQFFKDNYNTVSESLRRCCCNERACSFKHDSSPADFLRTIPR